MRGKREGKGVGKRGYFDNGYIRILKKNGGSKNTPGGVLA